MKRAGYFLLLLALAGMLNGCKPQPETETAETHELPNTVTLSPEAIRRSSLQTLTVSQRAAHNELTAFAEVRTDENRVFRINSLVSGRVVKDNAQLGDTVQQGQTLAVIQNLDVARIQADYIHELHQNEIDISKAQSRLGLAKRNLDRERRLLAEGISPRKDYYQAENDAAIARTELDGQREHKIHIQAEGRALLSAYGMRPGSVHTETIVTGTAVKTPKAGVVTQKSVTLGSIISPETTLYEVADLSQVWLDLTLYAKDVERVKLGQPVTFTTDAMPSQRFSGRVQYIQPASVQASQTFVARVFLANPQRLLKPGLLGQATIQTDSHTAKPFVPEMAVQKYGKEAFVFLDKGNGQYQKQTVTLGDQVAEGYFIQAGLKPGDRIVGKGSFTLKAEMLKSQFGEEE